MTINPYEATAVAGIAPLDVPAEKARRPISVWLLEALLLVVLVLTTIGLLQSLRMAILYPAIARQVLGVFVAETVARFAIGTAQLLALRSIHLRKPGGRWLGMLFLLVLVVLVFMLPDTTTFASDAERGGGWLARHVFIPGLLLWWCYAATFSRKARRYYGTTAG
ncbi:hypothetical protein SAMN02745857_03589 [Andreprevotia lacus DSM 23236]|jgi:hypothetical protein|uniref:Uncharacterized protein n=1 Tax=Andreprevotia lacus DSM 23236 TaxID=1121001 RepID=A0A1W1XZ02_9NEIS|nr:hypothetical protein [Andreprevotia lacus]SMC29087.1 hypothetical protein SAMN02745857_03589 [Andreprevotia lacus DSM 23236]